MTDADCANTQNKYCVSCARFQGVGLVASTSSLVRPEVVVRPDFAKAADLGVSSAAIAETLRIATAGDYDQDIAKLNLPNGRFPSSSNCATRHARTSSCCRASMCRVRAGR